MKNSTDRKLIKFSTLLFFAAPLAAAVMMSACSSPQNPQLGQGTEPDQKYTATSGATQAAKVPEVDILFVADDSDSMTKHLAGVHANMDVFAKQFAGDANVDYHVGLVKVFDSTRYGTPKVPVFVANGELQNDSLDKQLVSSLLAKTPAATPADQASVVESTQQWVGRSANEGQNAAGLKQLLEFNTKTINEGGPNKEEIFSPIVSAIVDPAASTGRNKGFYRPEANLAIIILTDAEDSSPEFLNPADAYDKSLVPNVKELLLRSKGGDMSKISIYAALAGTNCTMDIDNQQPDKIKSLIESFHGTTPQAKAAHEFNLCGDFASTMTKVGKDIDARAKVDTSIPLQRYLDQKMLGQVLVTYGTGGADAQIVQPGDWIYDAATNSINVVSSPKGVTVKAGAKFTASYYGMSYKEMVRRSKLKK